MIRWIVFEPPGSGPAARSAAARMVRDRFGWLAFLFAPVWLLWHRLWLEALALVALLVLAEFALGGEALAPARAAMPLLLGLLVALEGPNWRAARLRRRGWRETAVVLAADRRDAELRYFAAGDAQAPAAPDAAMPSTLPPPAPRQPATAATTARGGLGGLFTPWSQGGRFPS